jgi:hypothetical protein
VSSALCMQGVCLLCWLCFISHCGVNEPSWSEIRHFARFLDLQLQSCEKSVFTDPMLVGDVMAGFKGFVVKFMIRMSRVCWTDKSSGGLSVHSR